MNKNTVEARQKKCAYCGNLFVYSRSDAQYCSALCKTNARERRLGKARGELICEQCGTKFVPFSSRQRFCGRSCSTAYAHKHSWKEVRRICVDCGKEYLSQRKDRERCISCWKKYRSAQTMMYRFNRDPTIQIGVGSGGAQHPIVDVYTATGRAIINERRRQSYANRKAVATATINYRRILTGSDVCSCCGFSDSQDAIVVHHIDMDRTHHNDDNLSILCGNCHMRLHAKIRRANRGKSVCDPKQLYLEFKEEMSTEAKVKLRNEAGTYSSSQPEPKAERDFSQGQSVPAGEDIPSADTRPQQLDLFI